MTKLHSVKGGWVANRSVQVDGTATVYGLSYKQVTPVISGGEWAAMVEWCVNTFGSSGTENMPGVWSPDQRWYVNNARFFFREDQDLNLFLLRWQ